MNEHKRMLHLAVPKISLGLSSPLGLDLQARRGPPPHQTLSSPLNPALSDAKYMDLLPQLPDRCSCLQQQQGSWKLHLESSRCKPFLTKSERSALQGLLKNSKLPVPRPPGLACSTGGRTQAGSNSNLREKTGALRGLRRQQAYIHFSSPLQPAVKPSPSKSRPDENNLPAEAAAQRKMQPATLKYFPGARAQSLLVCGLSCLPLAWGALPLLPQIRKSRAEIHVYIPREEDITDCESLDEDVDNPPNPLSLHK
nr:uncharacterized protein LOC112546264 [Pelodiscus sinensis]|eukprot:XP_025041863.1 uncharacterized protein LOC112546264 [Pelodiscus sinensis]